MLGHLKLTINLDRLSLQFGGGNGVIVPTKDNGTTFGDPTKLTFPTGGQNASHPHQTIQYKDELLVPDLVRMCNLNLFQNLNNYRFFLRDAIPSGGSLPTKMESSRLEERSNSLLAVARVTLQSTTTPWSCFTSSRTPSPHNPSHL